MLLLSVITLGVVYAAYSFVAPAQLGIEKLGRDVAEILSGQSIGGVGRGGSGTSGTAPSTGPATTTAAPPRGSLNTRNPIDNDDQAPLSQDARDMMNIRNQMTGQPIVTQPGGDSA